MIFSGYSQYLSDSYPRPTIDDGTGSGSTIYYNNGTTLVEVGQSDTNSISPFAVEQVVDTAVPIVFPPADPNWFFEGYPNRVEAGDVNGNLIDFIPVSFFARNNGRVTIAFNPIDIYAGYIITNGDFVSNFQIDQDFAAGDFVFAICLKPVAGAARYSTIFNDSYWALLSEISNIQPGQTITKSVSLTSGVTLEESKSFSATIGATVGFKAGLDVAQISASLSTSLTQSFSSSVAITSQITVTDTVTFPEQPRVQRAALYQFVEQYNITPAQPLLGWRDYLNGTSTEEARFFSSQFICSVEQRLPFDYQSRHFATSFVLEPK